MPNPKMTQPKQVQRYLHIGIREAYNWETPDFFREEAGEALLLQMILNNNPDAPQWAGSTSHLYTEPLQIPVPSFDPVEKRLEAVDHELAEIRRMFYERKATLEEQRQNILALAGPSDDYIPRTEMPDDPEAY